jgi:hypothetical protein
MGYKQFLRSMEAAHRRQERASIRRHRELVKHAQSRQRENDKEAVRQEAANEVALFENYLEVLVSVHKDCGEVWDWKALSAASAPIAPVHSAARERGARHELASYKPGFFDRLFGKSKRVQAELQVEVERAVAADALDHERALADHRRAATLWDLRREIALGVLREEPAAYRRALEHVDPFSELADFKTRVVVAAIEPTVVSLACHLEDEELVPKEEIKLTAASKVSTKEMPAGRYWSLHQDFICSCALRAARETFAALPVPRVIVNVQATRMDTSTGHLGSQTLLAIHFARTDLQRLNVDAIDPSDSLKNFPHRMKFKKSAGFEPVAEITPDEQWVSA